MKHRYLPEGMRLGKEENREALATPASLEAAMRAGMILEAPVSLCDGQMRLHVDLGCMEGIIPREEAAFCRAGEGIKDIAVITRVGKPVVFIIEGFGVENGQRVAWLSRRAAQRACAARYLSGLVAGDLIPARVTHLESYGAFLDVGCGLSALLPIDCISVSRITHPRDRLRCGMTLTVAVKSIDRETGRIFATLKELLGTWEQNAARFAAGQTVTGKIRSIEPYGVFVELAPNLAGLAEPAPAGAARYHVGDTAAVFIKSILHERMKIKLVIVDSAPSESPPDPLHYYISTETTSHIDRWEYSPLASVRLIETVF
jgi:small subunit ribosomal protein S1